ncbi:MAG: RND family transporter [Myxococcota bacterium]
MADERQSVMEDRLPEQAFSMRFARYITRNRFATLMTLLSITFFFSMPLLNAAVYNITGHTLPGIEKRFQMNTRVRDQWPEHPFIHAQDKFEGRFGTASYVLVEVRRKNGDIYDADFLDKVSEITNQVDIAPNVNHYQVSSISSINTRVITIEPDGAITAEPLMEDIPEDEEEMAAFKDTVRQNPGRILGFLISPDETAVRVAAGFITFRLDEGGRAAYQALFDHFQQIKKDYEADGTIEIFITGAPVLIGWVYIHAFEITLFLLLTITLLFFLLLSYFRRLHGVAIPMVAGLSTAIWGMGFCAWMNITLDPLVLVIPLLITARSISHTIQMAERFFEDFEMEVDARERRLGRELTRDEIEEAKVETATTAMAKLMMPGMLGIITDAAGLLVLFITSIVVMKNLAAFGSFWVVAIIFNVILLHPIMIAYLPPPHESKHYTPRIMNFLLGGAGRLATSSAKFVLVGIVTVFFIGATYYTLNYSTIGESRPGAPIFWPDHPFNVATAEVARRFGGVDQFTVFVDGDQKGASADGFVLQRMEGLERYMRKYADPGNAVSLVTIIKKFWETNHYGDPKWGFVPDSAQSVAGIVFSLQRSSTPGALRPFLTDEQEDANVNFFFRDHKGTTIVRAVHYAEKYIDEHPMGRLNVRLVEDGSEVKDFFYYMLGPLLPPRSKSMKVLISRTDEEQHIIGYDPGTPLAVGEWTQPLDPAEVEKNVILAVVQLGGRKAARMKNEITADTPLRDGGLELCPSDPKHRACDTLLKILRKLSSEHDYRLESGQVRDTDVLSAWETIGDIIDRAVDRSEYQVEERWQNEEKTITAEKIRFNEFYAPSELWVQNTKFRDASFNPEPTGSWTRGAEFVLAGGLMGTYAAVNEEVERSHIANILLIFLIVFTFVSTAYRSLSAGSIIMYSLAMGTMGSLCFMAWRGNGLNINTLPVQGVGVGIGVDYAIYVTDRIRQEYSWCGDLDEGIRRAIRTTGMAVSFTATTLVGGIIGWVASNLRFQAEMAQLLVILMVINMLGGIVLVPAMFSIFRPKFFAASLSEEVGQPNQETEPRVATESA